MENQIWKDVPGYEGFYQVSSLGRVRSLDRVLGGRWGRSNYKGRIMKPELVRGGYLQVGLTKDTNRVKYRVHQLVAMAFLNHEPCGHEIVVDHIDNDKANNSLDNLQLITNRENCSKDKTGGTSKYVGVSWFEQTKKWHARIGINGKTKHLGYFTNEYEAHLAYQKALNEISKIKWQQLNLI